MQEEADDNDKERMSCADRAGLPASANGQQMAAAALPSLERYVSWRLPILKMDWKEVEKPHL